MVKVKTKKTFLLLLAVVSVVAIFMYLKRQVEIDKCLDNGGRWNYEKKVCEYNEMDKSN